MARDIVNIMIVEYISDMPFRRITITKYNRFKALDEILKLNTH
jgi:hypothetical protein